MNIRPILRASKTIWLSTHKSADGDGLGCEVALYHALKSQNYSVKIIHNDLAPKRYQFLFNGIEVIDINTVDKSIFTPQDLVIIFDTHDPKLCAPLFDFVTEAKSQIMFVDHHVQFEKKIEHVTYLIDEKASCTGEIVLQIIEELKINIHKDIAIALYASLLFDTQNFKHLRSPEKILDIAKQLIQYGADHNYIHRELFDTWSINKLNYLSKLISDVQYKKSDVAIIHISQSDLKKFDLITDDVSDLVDLFMTVRNINISIVIREENSQYYKLSFRSRSKEILSWAREFGGGGHLYSAGAWVKGALDSIQSKMNTLIESKTS